MDPYKFYKICEELLITTVKESIVKQRGNLKKHSGRHRDDSLRLIAKPNYQPCRDCLEIIPNRTIEIHREGFGTKYSQWYKNCGHCGKKTAISSPKDVVLNK